ncbi:tetratricopeptide repeat protein [bacterium]|nr:MAG: tetratricopeptide repeat protein [bacterium]
MQNDRFNSKRLAIAGRFPFLRNTVGVNLADFDRLYANRHEEPSLAQCAQFLEQAPLDYEWQWRRARLKHFEAMQRAEAGDSKGAKALYIAASSHASQATKIDAARVEGPFWSSTCDMEVGRLGNSLALMGVLVRVQKELQRAARINEEYHYAGPLRSLGKLTHLKPLALGGMLDGAIAFYERALQIAPRNSTNNLYLADALIADRQPKRAREAIRAVLEDSDNTNWVWETQHDQKLAQQWLQTRFD